MAELKNIKLGKLALSKAQQVAGIVPPDIATRVTALEQLVNSGYTGSIVVVVSVNFTAQTVVTKTITLDKGVVIGVV